jgi:hypothetical protein
MWLGALLGNQFRGSLDEEGLDGVREEADDVTRAGFTVLVAGQHVIGDPYVMVDPVVSLAAVSADLSRKYPRAPDIVIALVAGAWRTEEIRQITSSLSGIGSGKAGIALAAGYKPSDFRDQAAYDSRYATRRSHLAILSQPDEADKDPTVWVCANAIKSARLATPFGASCYVGPRVRLSDLLKMSAVLESPQSLVVRRDVLLHSGPGITQSPDHMAQFAADKYQALDNWGDTAAEENTAVKDEPISLISGNPDEVISQIRAFSMACTPAGIVFRLSWPDMPRNVANAHAHAFCEAVVPALEDVASLMPQGSDDGS